VDFTNTVLILTSKHRQCPRFLDLAGDPARHGEMEKRVNEAARGSLPAGVPSPPG